MRSGGALQRGIRLRRVEKGGGERLLILDREPQNLYFLNGPLRGLVRCRDDEIAHATPLYLGGALDDGQRLGGKAGFDARRPGR